MTQPGGKNEGLTCLISLYYRYIIQVGKQLDKLELRARILYLVLFLLFNFDFNLDFNIVKVYN